MIFNHFLSNEKVKQQISCLIDTNRLPQAIVIEGEEGLGKRTLAQEIAQALVCRSDKEKPCGVCSQCKKALDGVHPDIFEYTPEGGSRSFHKEIIKKVIDDTAMSPNESEYKVYILANCQYMSESAQNAILKVLEEPPSFVCFILTVNNKSALLPTVLSRSVVFSIDGVPLNAGAEYITSKNSSVSYEDAVGALTLYNGNIGKSMSSLDDGKISESAKLCNDICDALLKENEYELIKICSAFQKDRQGIVSACCMLKNIFRDALVYSSGSSLISGNNDVAHTLSVNLTKDALIKLTQTVDTIKIQAEQNSNNAVLITKFCYALRSAIGR